METIELLLMVFSGVESKIPVHPCLQFQNAFANRTLVIFLTNGNWKKYDESESRIRSLLLSWQTLYRLSYPVAGPFGLARGYPTRYGDVTCIMSSPRDPMS